MGKRLLLALKFPTDLIYPAITGFIRLPLKRDAVAESFVTSPPAALPSFRIQMIVLASTKFRLDL